MTSPSTGPLLSSEQELERLFRAGFSRWVEDAKNRLGSHAVAAPRVVSKAYHLAWTDRQRLRSQEELDAFLGANIAHGSVRELSRRAGLARMAHGEHHEPHDHAEMNVDEAWDRLSHTLQGGTPEGYRKRASLARHEVAGHMGELGAQKFNWKPLVAIGVIGVVAAIAGFIYVETAGKDRAILRALTAQDVRAYETSYGQQANVTLDDSTLVRIGPETKLTVPKMFNIELRSVAISGTANFEVTRTMDTPFEVRVGDVAITAKGTVFTVRRFKDDAAVVIHVRQGTVDVRSGRETRNIAEGLSLMVSDSGTMSVPSAEALAEASTWVDGNISIQSRSLKNALPQLKRWWALDLRVQDTTLLDRNVIVRAATGSSTGAIAAVEQSGGLKFTYIGDYMAFKDTQPSKGALRTKGK
jgi:ferric-dicitrate binding protein FerR (iron transport regulator)